MKNGGPELNFRAFFYILTHNKKQGNRKLIRLGKLKNKIK